MITATFYYVGHTDASFVTYPNKALGLERFGQKPYRCKITGMIDDEDRSSLENWANDMRKVLEKGGKVVIDMDNHAEGTVDKQIPEAETRRVNPIMQFFEYEHLPEELHEVSAKIGMVAHKLDQTLPDCAEKSAGLRKLLEAKDCFVRALLVR